LSATANCTHLSWALIQLQQERERISKLIAWSCGYQESLLVLSQQEPELRRLIHEQELELATLQALQRRILSHITNHKTVARKFRGKSNPYKEQMYVGVVRIWTDIVRGELKYSRNPMGGPPYGPAIQFLACLSDTDPQYKTPGDSRLADIIDNIRNP